MKLPLPLSLSLCLLGPVALAQTWQAQGTVPVLTVAADVDGDTSTVVTLHNVYRSTDGGATWAQRLSPANAPFLAPGPDGLTTERTGFTTISTEGTAVFGDVVFLVAQRAAQTTTRTAAQYTIYSSRDGGATLAEAFVEDDAYRGATYGYRVRFDRLSDTSFIATFGSNGVGPAGERTSVYRSDDTGLTWRRLFYAVPLEYAFIDLVPVFPGQDALAFFTRDSVFLHDPITGGRFAVSALPAPVEAGGYDQANLYAVEFGTDDLAAGQARVYRSRDGATYTIDTLDVGAGTVRSAQIIDGYLFVGLRAGPDRDQHVRYTLPDLAERTVVLTDSLFRFPEEGDLWRRTTDGRLINARLGYRADYRSLPVGSVEPPEFVVSSDSGATAVRLAEPAFSLAAMPALAGKSLTYDRAFAGGFQTSDGRTFTKTIATVNRAYDVHNLRGAVVATAYSDPSAYLYLTSDGTTLNGNDDYRPVWENGNGKLYRAESSSVGRQVEVSDDLGKTWARLPGATLYGTRLPLGDPKTNTWLSFGTGASAEDAFAYLSRDLGQTWGIVEGLAPQPLDRADVQLNSYRETFTYNDNLFFYDGEALRVSRDGGKTFTAVATPFSLVKAQVYVLGNRLGVQTYDERYFSADLDAWLGTEPAVLPEGAQTDLSLAIEVTPAAPKRFDAFQVTVTVSNASATDASSVDVQLLTGRQGGVIVEGGKVPTGDLLSRRVPAGGSASATYYYYVRDEVDVEVWGQIQQQRQPDIDSRAGNKAAYATPTEDDEVAYVPVDACANDTIPPVFADCPRDTTVFTDSTAAAVTFAVPTASDACSPALAYTWNAVPGSFFPLGTTRVEYVASDVSGNAATCAFSITVKPDTTSAIGERERGARAEMRVFPNPARLSGASTLALEVAQAGRYVLEVYDALGRRTHREVLTLPAGRAQVALSAAAMAHVGAYTVTLTGGVGARGRARVVVVD